MKLNRFTTTILLSFLIAFLNTSCLETKTNNPREAYKYWAGLNPPIGLGLIKGQYWQSAHWTKEYIMYLKFKPSQKWWDGFIKQNHISLDNGDWTVPNDAPLWFKPTENSIRYDRHNDFDQGSRYFRDSLTGICYIYEIQL